MLFRTSASFTLGSSGGGLFDLDFNLIGITTFKSPGRRFGNFYCIPVEWVERLLQEEPQIDLVSKDRPFWSLPDEEKPFFIANYNADGKEEMAENVRHCQEMDASR